MNKTKTAWLFVFAILICSAVCQAAYGQTKEGRALESRITDLEVENASLRDVLLRIARDYRVPIGLEDALARNASPTITMKLSGSGQSLKKVFDSLVKQDDRYTWRSADGVFFFSPVKDRDELLTAVLDTPVDQFVIQPKTDKLEVRSRIANLPGVLAKLNAAGVEPLIVDLISSGRFNHEVAPNFSLSVENTTVRELLDTIVKQSDVKLWVVNRFGERGQYFVLAL